MRGKTGLRKNLATSLLTGLAVLGPCFITTANAQSAEGNKKQTGIHYIANAGFGMDVQPSPCEVSNVPVSVRNVPLHPNDTYAIGNEGPISDVLLKCPRIHGKLKGSLGLGVHTGPYKLEAGGSITHRLISESHIRKRNYTNDVGSETRGYGAALTFYGLRDGVFDKNDLVPGAFVQFSQRNSGGSNIFFRYELDFSNLNIKTGWDRYNALQNNESFRLADLTNHTFKIGYEVRDGNYTGRAFAGYVRSVQRPTELGKQTTMKIGNQLVFGFDILFGR